jgi:hypothetical protein
MTTPYIERTKRFEFKRDANNGMLIGPKGCHYDTEAEAFYFDQIGLCGCGRPKDVHAFLLKCLTAGKDDYPAILDYKKIEKLVADNIEIVAEFVLHFLDDVELTEHGSSLYGSWLTERGKQAVEIGVMKEKDNG